MNLFTTFLNINHFQEKQFLYVEQPWSPESEVELREIDLAKNINLSKFEFFIEVSELKSLLQHFENKNVCLRETCYLIIEYILDQK